MRNQEFQKSWLFLLRLNFPTLDGFLAEHNFLAGTEVENCDLSRLVLHLLAYGIRDEAAIVLHYNGALLDYPILGKQEFRQVKLILNIRLFIFIFYGISITFFLRQWQHTMRFIFMYEIAMGRVIGK